MPKKGRPPEFREEDKLKMLLWSDRHCCLCKKSCGTDIEIAHIDATAGNNIENGIPLCYDCHAEIGRYNREHPKGNKYKPAELKARRDQIYEEYTRHLVPPINFVVTQNRIDGSQNQLPFVGFHLQHLGDSLPVNVRVEVKIILGENDLGIVQGSNGYYDGAVKWNINPRILFWGGFGIPQEYISRMQEKKEDLKVEVRVTVIDQFGREHKLLSQCFRYIQNGNFWNLEPRAFTTWT